MCGSGLLARRGIVERASLAVVGPSGRSPNTLALVGAQPPNTPWLGHNPSDAGIAPNLVPRVQLRADGYARANARNIKARTRNCSALASVPRGPPVSQSGPW